MRIKIVEKAKKAITKKIEAIKHACTCPHIRAIAWIIVIFILSGFLTFILIDWREAAAATLASICAGCITGIAFYVITNKRNNEIQATKEEREEADKKYQLARDIMHLCSDTIGCYPYPEKNIKDICSTTKKLLTYVGTICFDAPKITKIIQDFPSEYNEKVEQAADAIDMLEKTEADGYTKEQGNKALMDIMEFCEATKGILLKPHIQLMLQAAKLEKSNL